MTILNRFLEEVWNQGNESAIDELATPGVKGRGLVGPDGNEVDGTASFRTYYHNFRAIFSDIHVAVENTLSEGDMTVTRCTVTARHTGEGMGKSPKGNTVRFAGMMMARIEGGKLAEVWNNFDFATMLQQME